MLTEIALNVIVGIGGMSCGPTAVERPVNIFGKPVVTVQNPAVNQLRVGGATAQPAVKTALPAVQKTKPKAVIVGNKK